MATRFYLSNTEAAPVSPTISAEWEHKTTERRAAITVPDASALFNLSYIPDDAADHLVNADSQFRQYVTVPLGAQTIPAQTFAAQFQCREFTAFDNLFLTIKVFVVSLDGLTIKETLLAITRDTVEVVSSATLTNRRFTALTTIADLEDNDRLVFEIGLGGTPTAGTGINGHNGVIRFGVVAAGGDLPLNDTDTTTNKRPWVEFPETLTFPSIRRLRTLVGQGF